MRTSKFTPEQVAMALRQAESGIPVAEICRKLQVTEQTFYIWNALCQVAFVSWRL
jgi:putative transposase